jgi:hypothetical protein
MGVLRSSATRYVIDAPLKTSALILPGARHDSFPRFRCRPGTRGALPSTPRPSTSHTLWPQDAHTISTLLAHPLTTRTTVARALQAYSQTRLPIAQQFIEGSREHGMRTSFNWSPDAGLSLSELGARIDAASAITREGDPLEDPKAAVTLFESLLT